MIYYILVFVAGLLFAIGLLLLKKPFFSFALSTTSLLNAILDVDSDEDTKQKHLIKKLGPLLGNMFVFLALLLLSIGVASVPLAKYLWLDTTVVPDTSSMYFYLCLGIGSLIPFVIPIKRTTDSDYSDWSMLLHRMILDNPFIGRALFQFERRVFKEKLNREPRPFVIVTGLARAGTTALTNLLYKTGNFHSLAYDNMPFILAPNLWKKVYKAQDTHLKERAHGDQVQFGYKTIEALEEVFFKAYSNDSFIGEKTLNRHELSQKAWEHYNDYRNLVASQSSNSTYLAKNNNLILRYESIRTTNPEFKAVVIFRDPLDHAASLLSQHNRFSKMHSQDPFTLEYMNWLGHHEFGLNHKPFNFGQETNPFEPSTINYWLYSWLDYHKYILTLPENDNLILVDYSDLLKEPAQLVKNLKARLGVSLTSDSIEVFQPREKEKPMADKALVGKAYEVHHQLQIRATGASTNQ